MGEVKEEGLRTCRVNALELAPVSLDTILFNETEKE
jgi:hypothetical protein